MHETLPQKLNDAFPEKSRNSIWSFSHENKFGYPGSVDTIQQESSSFLAESSVHGLKYLGQAGR